ncbi:Signal recognition particle receptor FtsY [hydrothermal vent metagenome]|uniref:Signal recognition particle receptor FtsY n=1 Tax=hydrothermal vent metagenome TaxID=652676 RepID=A0A3B0VT46_9ZZZZ
MFSFLRRKKKTHTEETSVDIEETQPIESVESVVNKIPKQPESAEPLHKDTPEPPVEVVQTIDSPVKVVEKNSTPESPRSQELVQESHQESVQETKADQKPQKTNFFTRLKQGLSKTRQNFTDSLATLVLGRKEIDDDLLDELEMILLTADVGIDATDKIIKNLTDQVSRNALKDPEALISALKSQLEAILEPVVHSMQIEKHLANNKGPFVILMVGINGVGKTTTIGKLAKKFQSEGKSVMLAAGDTFRAAAVEQLQTWGERNNVPVIAQKTGADSAAVLFDAIQSAQAKKIDVLIADTAGRLHTQSNLMEELKKVTRVMAKVDDSAPHEVMLVIDAGTGQNALNQAKQFKEAVNVSGITLTKLDGTAKGGIVFALAEQSNIPIRFIGVGESIDDLRPFDSKAFIKALFDQTTKT